MDMTAVSRSVHRVRSYTVGRYTIRELAGLIVNTVGYQGELTFDSSKPDGTMRKLTDPSKLHNLGWHHKIDIEEGVQKMYEWYLG